MEKSAGEIIWHAPFQIHATKTFEQPMLAVWAWTKDVATPAKLVSTASGYLDALKQEDAKFQQAANNQMQSQISNKQSQISNFDAVIKQKSEQIQKNGSRNRAA